MKMKLFLILALVASPAAAATTSADLETVAKALEQNTAPSSTLNSKLLSLLREPALTLDQVTLPTTPSLYTKSVDTALRLRPAGWVAGEQEQFAPAAAGVNCTAHLAFWSPAAPAGLRTEAFAWGVGNCPSVLSAAIARAWSWKLKQVGR